MDREIPRRTAAMRLGTRLARATSVAGSWAMRPQTAMAALFLVMIGTSVLLIRGKSSRAPASAEITVTEEGTPAPTNADFDSPAVASGAGANSERPSADDGAALGTPAEDAAVAAAPAFEAALSAYQSGRFDEARRAFDALASTNANAALWAARSLREAHGCGASVARFDEVAQGAPGTPPAWDALFEGARCRTLLGDVSSARTRLGKLLSVAAFADRARAELDRIGHVQSAPQKP
jgi:TolA-binding protein